MSRSSSKIRGMLTAAAIAFALLPVLADADPPAAVRIGALMPRVITSPEEGLREGLSELGYAEGRNLIVESRRADSGDALRSAAAELVQLRVDLIVAFGTPAAHAALAATSTIPVVLLSGDPVAAGLAASLARPGANGTGVSSLSTARCRSGWSSCNRSCRALVVSSCWVIRTVRCIHAARLPAIFPWREYHEHGVVMSYSPNIREIMRRGAYYVDRIFKGAKPSELPVEQVSKFDLIIDLRVAREMILVRADEVIR